jgi:Tol biopolymer transport system component
VSARALFTRLRIAWFSLQELDLLRTTGKLTSRRRVWIGGVTAVVVVGCGGAATTSPTTNASSTTASPIAPTPTSGLPAHGRIAFQLEFGPNGDDCNIVTIEPDGTDLRMLTNVAAGSGCYGDPAWNPSGDRIFFDKGGNTSSHLFSISAAGGSVRQLIFGSPFDADPAISPDGTRIAFDRGGGPNPPAPGIFLMNVDGRDIVRLTTPPSSSTSGDGQPNFSPDGTKLAFVRDGAIYIIGTDGKGLREVTRASLDAARPRWSPDGSTLLFGNPDTASPAVGQNVYVVNADGTELHQLTNETEPNSAGAPAWAPDGTMIVFNQFQDGTHFVALVVMHRDGSDPIVIWHPTPYTNNFPVNATWGTAP